MKRVHCCFLVNSTLNTKHEVVYFVVKSVILLQHRCTSLSAFSSRLNTVFQLISPFILNLLKMNMFNFTNTAKFPRKSSDSLIKKARFCEFESRKTCSPWQKSFLVSVCLHSHDRRRKQRQKKRTRRVPACIYNCHINVAALRRKSFPKTEILTCCFTLWSCENCVQRHQRHSEHLLGAQRRIASLRLLITLINLD